MGCFLRKNPDIEICFEKDVILMIYIMMKPVSGKCNMDCSYCFYRDEINKREIGDYGLMKEETLEQIIKKAIEKAERECVFAYQGGEPTLAGIDFYKKSMEYQKKYNMKGIRIQNVIQTNGYGIDAEWCEFFKKNEFLVGVSLDGIKITHDKFRKSQSGEDTYFKIIEHIELLKEYEVEFNILTVVNKAVASKIDRIYENYRKRGFLHQQYIICMEPLGEAGGKRDYSLSPKEYGEFLNRLFELWRIDIQNGRKIYIRQFENWINIVRGEMPEACEQRGICGRQIIIEADGSVFPCDFYALDSYKIGNIIESTLEEIEENRKTLGFIERSYNHVQDCLDCEFFRICRGGCNRYREEGKNIFCEGYRKFFEEKYELLLKIAKERY